MRRRAEQHHVAAGDDLLVGVEGDEATVGRHVDPAGDGPVALELFEAAVEPVGEGVAHGVELDVGIGV